MKKISHGESKNIQKSKVTNINSSLSADYSMNLYGARAKDSMHLKGR